MSMGAMGILHTSKAFIAHIMAHTQSHIHKRALTPGCVKKTRIPRGFAFGFDIFPLRRGCKWL